MTSSSALSSAGGAFCAPTAPAKRPSAIIGPPFLMSSPFLSRCYNNSGGSSVTRKGAETVVEEVPSARNRFVERIPRVGALDAFPDLVGQRAAVRVGHDDE